MRLRRVEPILRRALRGACAPLRPARGAPAVLLVAVSGGADSTALLIGLRNLASELGLDLHAAHLHHGLRGAEADRDLESVRALCARLGLPLLAARWNVRIRMRRRGLSGEAGLRRLRREFLLGAARRAGAANIVTAHTADDQLETLLMRLGRGTGLPGLAGMRPTVLSREAPPGRVAWLKPLLGATRSQVEADLARVRQPWREDRSNRDPRYTRNRVRHEAVPALAKALMPGAGPAPGRARLARNAASVAAEVLASVRALEGLAARVLRRAGRIQPGVSTLHLPSVARLHPAVRAALLRRLWARIGPQDNGLTGAHLAALGRLIDSARGGGIIQLPGGWTAERARDDVRFSRRPPGGSSASRESRTTFASTPRS
jgi:tRNA(Ile)-lysidine synthase